MQLSATDIGTRKVKMESRLVIHIATVCEQKHGLLIHTTTTMSISGRPEVCPNCKAPFYGVSAFRAALEGFPGNRRLKARCNLKNPSAWIIV